MGRGITDAQLGSSRYRLASVQASGDATRWLVPVTSQARQVVSQACIGCPCCCCCCCCCAIRSSLTVGASDPGAAGDKARATTLQHFRGLLDVRLPTRRLSWPEWQLGSSSGGSSRQQLPGLLSQPATSAGSIKPEAWSTTPAGTPASRRTISSRVVCSPAGAGWVCSGGPVAEGLPLGPPR